MPKGKGQPKLDEASLTAHIAQNPELLAAVNSKLSGLAGHSSGYIESLPAAVKARVNALKNIQVEWTTIESKLHKEIHQLEMKYLDLFQPLYLKRETIANGAYEPTEEECHWEEHEDSDDEEENKEGDEKKAKKLSNELTEKATLNEDTKGIPEFWLTAMKNIDLVVEMIQPHDEDVLKKLSDIRVRLTDAANTEGEECDMGFILEFHFCENEYFENKVLTKTYRMKSDPDSDDPFEFEGPEIIGCTGCSIEWKKGKDITHKLVKKKQKHKGGQTRVVTKSVKNDSFFNFFDPPEVVEEDELDEETEALLSADFEIGHFIKERLIPKAVLYFTGEAVEEEDDEEFGSDDDDDDDDADDDEDEENDPDYKPDAQAQNEQCKQQ